MKQTCPSAKTLERFLNEELKGPLSEKVARHLASCANCQTQCETLTQAMDTPSAVVDSVKSERVLDDLINRLIDSHGRATGVGTNSANPRIQFAGPADDRAPLGRLGHYAIQELIAEGAQGVLYRAHDEMLHRAVAIKLVHHRLTQSATALERFRREARLIAAVQSDHVIRVFQVGSEPGFPPFLVMEFVAGESLRDRIDRREPISFRQAVQIVRDTALGLQAAHQKGLIHRDVKPSNILLDQSTTRARLTDFGLAVEETELIRMTQEGTILGTPAYMSPEQVIRPEATDARSDLYSLAVVFYELLTGEMPFRGTVRMTLLQVAHEEPRPPRQYNDGIPKDLETICLKAMSKDPASRFPDASKFIDELDRWAAGREILSRPISRTERFWRWCRRNPVVSALCATVLVLLLTLSTVTTWSSIRLAASSEASRQSAVAAQEQSAASLDTLSKLIFQLQEHFDHDETDIDELQKDTLQIALAGLRKVRLSADSKNAPQLPTAAALRRLGELLSRLGEDDEGLSCLQQAENILRAELKTNPNNTVAMKTLVEVLSSRDDFNLQSAQRNDVIIREAVSYARKRKELDKCDDATFMLAGALMRQGSMELDAGETSAAVKSQQEAMTLSDSLTHEESDYSVASQLNWLIAADILYVANLDSDRVVALKHLKTAIQRATEFAKTNLDDIDFALNLLGLQERLVSHLGDFDNAAALQEATVDFESRAKKISQAAKADWETFYSVSETFSEFRDGRLAEDNLLSAKRLAMAMISISADRLEIDPNDSFARETLASYWSDVGDLKNVLEDPANEVSDCYEKSLVEFRTLSTTDWFEEGDWIEYLDVLFSATEFASDAEHNSLTTLQDEIARVLKTVDESHPDFEKEWQAEFLDRLKELKTLPRETAIKP